MLKDPTEFTFALAATAGAATDINKATASTEDNPTRLAVFTCLPLK